MPISSLRRARRQASRICPPGCRRRLEQRDLMAPRSGDARRLQAARPGAHHDHLAPGTIGARDAVRHRRLAPGGGVVHAQRVIALVDPIEAIGRADTGSDFHLTPRGQQPRDMRLGDMGAGHADHVEFACNDRMPRRRHVLDARRVEHREARRRAHLAGEIQVRRRAHPHDWDHPRQRRVGVHVAADHVEEIHFSPRHQAAGDLDAFRAREADVPVLISHQAHADDEARIGRGANGGEHLADEAQPVVQAAAIFVVALVGRRRPELVGQVAVGVELDPVQPGRRHPRRGRGVIRNDARDVPVFQRLGERTMRRLAHRRRRQHRQPVGLVPRRPPPEMGDLDHHRRAMRVAVVRQAAQPRHDLVLVGEQVAEHRRRVGRDHRRARGHRQRDAALGLFHVVQPVAVLRHAVLAVVRLVRGAHQPVAQRQVAELERLQQRVGGGRGGHRW
jgi:hypothetical protein